MYAYLVISCVLLSTCSHSVYKNIDDGMEKAILKHRITGGVVSRFSPDNIVQFLKQTD